MANRLFRSEFLNSFFKKPVMLAGYADLGAPTKAFLLLKGVTITDLLFGVARNGVVTLAYTTGGTAGAEVVTVVGNAISVQIESGVSTITQVRTAINASGAAAALVVATGTSGTAVTGASAATPTAGAVESVTGFYMPGVASILQDPAAAGTYIITLQDKYSRLVAAKYHLQAATAVDLVPQQKSEAVSTTKLLSVRLLTGATATNPAAAARLYMDLTFNDSSLN